MNEQMRALLEKILIPGLVAYGLYLGYDYYNFMNDPASPLKQKQAQIQAIQQETDAVLTKVKNAQEFYRTLEARREELRKLVLQLEEVKATLSEQIDVSAFVRMVVLEAKKVGLVVEGIRPTEMREREYYVEQSFDFKFKGVYVQLEVFLQRLAGLERIVRIGQFHLKPFSPANSQYVQLEGELELDTYRYRGSKADELGQSGAAISSSSQGQNTSAQGTQPAVKSGTSGGPK